MIRWGILTIVLAKLLTLTQTCWKGRGAEYAVPAALLGLAVIAAWSGEAKAARASAVLRYGIIGVVGAILISGITRIDKNIDVYLDKKINYLFPIVTLVILKSEPKYKNGKISIIAALLALITSMVVGGNLGKRGSFYQLSKSISLFGTIERYESLASAAITLGLFAALTVIMVQSGKSWKQAGLGREQIGLCAGAVVAAWLYLIPWEIREEQLMIAVVLFWALIPSAERFLKKGIDKNGKRW